MISLKKNIHWVVVLIMLCVLITHVITLHFFQYLSWEISALDGGISTSILGFSIWGIILLIRAYPTNVAITIYALFVALFVSSVTTYFEFETIMWWIDEVVYEDYTSWLLQTLPIRFFVIWMFSTWVSTISAFRKNMASLDSRFMQQVDASALHKEAELFKLRQQLQPHFLYNSLNSINALIIIEPSKAQEMVGKLSDFLRSSVKKESDDMIPVEEELNYINSYLAIESIRFGDRLQVDLNTEDISNAKIPPFLLQPILENAIKFGLYGNLGKVVVNISITMRHGLLVLSVSNPFDPNTQPPRGTGFGLEGIRRRLYLMFARTDLLITNKSENQFVTTLKIPQKDVQSDIN